MHSIQLNLISVFYALHEISIFLTWKIVLRMHSSMCIIKNLALLYLFKSLHRKLKSILLSYFEYLSLYARYK